MILDGIFELLDILFPPKTDPCDDIVMQTNGDRRIFYIDVGNISKEQAECCINKLKTGFTKEF